MENLHETISITYFNQLKYVNIMNLLKTRDSVPPGSATGVANALPPSGSAVVVGLQVADVIQATEGT